MLSQTVSWFCDTCGELIECAEHGYVEWIDLPVPDDAPPKRRNVRIVHHLPHSNRKAENGCQFDPQDKRADGGYVSDAALSEFQGPDGLIYLLELLIESGEPDLSVLEIIKRIHIPGYEVAWRHADQAISAGIIEPDGKPGFLRQANIELILKHVKQQGLE